MTEEGRRIGDATAIFSRTIEVESLEVFAQALRLDHPIYRNIAAARAAGFRDRVAPPGYVIAFTVVPKHAKLKVLGLDERSALAGGMTFDAREPICAGDTLTGRCVLIGIEEKQGARPFTLLRTKTDLTNQFGRLALAITDTSLEFRS